MKFLSFSLVLKMWASSPYNETQTYAQVEDKTYSSSVVF